MLQMSVIQPDAGLGQALLLRRRGTAEKQIRHSLSCRFGRTFPDWPLTCGFMALEPRLRFYGFLAVLSNLL
jgi:hypothetical protein